MNWKKLKEAIEIVIVSFILTAIVFITIGLFIQNTRIEGLTIFCMILIPAMIAHVICRIYEDL